MQRTDGERNPFRRRGARVAAALLLAATLPFLAGCIYLRLLELKHQLADFDRHFAVGSADGLALTFRDPVLLDADMDFLGLATTDRRRSGVAERWHVSWEKVRAPGDDAAPPTVESLDLVFVDHRLATLLVPERFFVFFPKNVVLAGLRALGRSRVDRARRSVTTAVAAAEIAGVPAVLPADALAATLGEPTSRGGTAAAPEWRYRFQPAAASRGSGPIDLTFTIDPAAGEVRRIQGRLIFRTFDFTYPAAAAK